MCYVLGMKKPKGDGPNVYMTAKAASGPKEQFIYICLSLSINVSSSLSLTSQKKHLMSLDKFSHKVGRVVVKNNGQAYKTEQQV